MYLNHKINYNNGDKLNASAWNSLASDVNELGQAIENVSSVSDKTYNSAQHSGLGVKELKMNGSNVLAQSDFQNANTIYNVTYDFNLNNAEITMPQGSVLNLDGGSFTNGRIISNDTILKGQITDATKACLFGVFYDENKNPLGWDKNRITDWYTNTEYGNYIDSVEKGIDFGMIKAVATDNNYVYLLFSDDSDPINNSVVLYDRNYNYIGYSPLSRHCSIEGACIYNNIMYVACGTTVSDGDSIFTINLSTIISNCAYNKGKELAQAHTTDVTPIRLGFNCVSIDYDSVTNTFCLGTPTAFYKIYDTQFNLIKTSTLTNYSQFGFNEFGRQTCRQDFVYQNGIIYALDNDQNPEVNTNQSDGVLYIIDVATDKVVLDQPIDYQTRLCSSYGLCKDTVTDSIFIACNNFMHTFDTKKVCIFTIASINQQWKRVSNNLQNSVDDRFSASEEFLVVNVDSTYTGRSYGFGNSPYKTLGEALVMSRGTKTSYISIHKNTGPYYVKDITLRNRHTTIYSDAAMGNFEEYPTLDIKLNTYSSHVSILKVTLEASDYHNSRPFNSSTLPANQNAIICASSGHLECYGVYFKLNDATNGVIHAAIYAADHGFVRLHSDTKFEANTGINVDGYVKIGVGGATVAVNGIVASAGTIFTFAARSCDIHVLGHDALKLTGSALLINNSYYNPDCCTVYGLYTGSTLGEFNRIKALFKSADGTRLSLSYAFKFFVTQNITDTNGNIIPAGVYTNVHKTINNVTDQYIVPLYSISNQYSTVTSSTLPAYGEIGKPVFNSTTNKPLWWNGTNWVDATGTVVN